MAEHGPTNIFNNVAPGIPREGREDYAVELKATELTLHVPQPLVSTLQNLARYRHCSVEALVLRLIADNPLIQKYLTREVLNLWEYGEDA